MNQGIVNKHYMSGNFYLKILANISRNKDNQAVNLRNIFTEKPYTKYGEKTIPRHCFKNSKLSISVDQYSKVLNILFLFFVKLRTIDIY